MNAKAAKPAKKNQLVLRMEREGFIAERVEREGGTPASATLKGSPYSRAQL
jgi:hypothetical protein